MGLIGSQIETGGRNWRVASIVRGGPEFRIVFRAVDEPGDTLTARVEGVTPPSSLGDLRAALSHAEARTFHDETGARWKVEIRPHFEGGRPKGEYLVFSAEMSSERFKMRHDSPMRLSSLSDVELRKGLRWARDAQSASV